MERTFKFALLSCASVALGACSSLYNGPEHALSVAEEHPISVDTQVVTMTMDLEPGAQELSSIDTARLKAFADAYLTDGHGPLSITAPSGSGDDSSEAAAEIRQSLNDVGVPWSRLSGATYRTGDSNGEVVLSFTHYVATPSECGDWRGLRARSYRNLRAPNYGCATQNNLAAVIADPRDLVSPSAIAPRDSLRRSVVFDTYRSGEVTSASRDSEIEAEISE